jgi:hypothetical protein
MPLRLDYSPHPDTPHQPRLGRITDGSGVSKNVGLSRSDGTHQQPITQGRSLLPTNAAIIETGLSTCLANTLFIAFFVLSLAITDSCMRVLTNAGHEAQHLCCRLALRDQLSVIDTTAAFDAMYLPRHAHHTDRDATVMILPPFPMTLSRSLPSRAEYAHQIDINTQRFRYHDLCLLWSPRDTADCGIVCRHIRRTDVVLRLRPSTPLTPKSVTSS